MILISLIKREMRTVARQPSTYHLRLTGVGSLLSVLAILIGQGGGMVGSGGPLFARLHAVIVFGCLTLIPLVAGDSISRERREGTLGMLLLTPLKPWQIVVAKGTAHAVVTLSMWLAVLPIMAIPFLVGGLSWREGLLSMLVVCSCICLSLAAALIASSRARSATQALIIAGSIAIAFFCVLALTVGLLDPGRGNAGSASASNATGCNIWSLLDCGFQWALDNNACWGTEFRGGSSASFRTGLATSRPSLIIAFSLAAAVSLGVLIASLWLAGLGLGRGRTRSGPSVWWTRLQQRLFAPFCLKGLLRRWMRWELDHNPVGWLEERTWSGRLVTWSWVAVVASTYATLFANLQQYQRSFHSTQRVLAGLLMLTVAVSSVRSFQRERQSGLLELILVSPLKPLTIIGGRLRGLWLQFLPATALLVGVWAYFAINLAWTSTDIECVLFSTSTFLTLPVIGLYRSLSSRNLISAFLFSMLSGVIAPALFGKIGSLLICATLGFNSGTQRADLYVDGLLYGIPLQGMITVISACKLCRILKTRRFPFGDNLK